MTPRKKSSTRSDIIVPSTKLKTVSVHKLFDTSCSRYYFWRWIMNMIPNKFHPAFWFGSYVHAGIEQVGAGKKLSVVKKAMMKEDKKTCKKNPPSVELVQEIKAQRKIGLLMIKTYREIVKEKMRGLKFGGAEVHFEKRLKQSPVIFEGTVDAWYKSAKKIVLFEGKTASRPDNDYFKRLKFDKQINGYAIGLHDILGQYPRECYYTVFRKPQIRQRKNETPEDFFERLEGDLIERKDWYFIFFKHLFGKAAVQAVLNDIEWMTFDLAAKYDYLTEDQLLDPKNWPRNDHQCFNYGTCPYFGLCRRPKSYPLYYRFYTMRDIRYETEKRELNKKRAFSTRVISKMKKSK